MCKALSVKFELISQLIKQSKICCSSLLSIFKHVAERMLNIKFTDLLLQYSITVKKYKKVHTCVCFKPLYMISRWYIFDIALYLIQHLKCFPHLFKKRCLLCNL